MQPPAASLLGRPRRLTLVAAILGTSIVFVDMTVVNVALPSIERDLHISISELEWIVTAYALTFAAFMLTGGKIGDIIGPKGKIIRGIQEQTGAEINVEDDGVVTISAVDGPAGERARDMIAAIVQEPEIGKVYEGVVKSTTPFGAFVEILPGTEGLLHISELQHGRTERTEDVVKKGDVVRVKLLEVDSRGKMRLSRKALLDQD